MLVYQMTTEATTPWQLLVPRPAACSAAAAAALPTVYTTVDVAFAELAKLKKGEKATEPLRVPTKCSKRGVPLCYPKIVGEPTDA